MAMHGNVWLCGVMCGQLGLCSVKYGFEGLCIRSGVDGFSIT